MGDGIELVWGLAHPSNVWTSPNRARISVQGVVTDSENSIAVPAPLLGAYNASKHAVLDRQKPLTERRLIS